MNAPTQRRRPSSRTALVLGGGGFTGGVYQIGALRALDLLSSNRSVNQFDIYVGTSAGALIASLVANGVTPPTGTPPTGTPGEPPTDTPTATPPTGTPPTTPTGIQPTLPASASGTPSFPS